MGKGRIHVSIDDALLEALRVRASKLRCHQSDVITLALQRELSLELFDQTWEDRVGMLESEPQETPAAESETVQNGAPADVIQVNKLTSQPGDNGGPAAALPWRQT